MFFFNQVINSRLVIFLCSVTLRNAFGHPGALLCLKLDVAARIFFFTATRSLRQRLPDKASSLGGDLEHPMPYDKKDD